MAALERDQPIDCQLPVHIYLTVDMLMTHMGAYRREAWNKEYLRPIATVPGNTVARPAYGHAYGPHGCQTHSGTYSNS